MGPRSAPSSGRPRSAEVAARYEKFVGLLARLASDQATRPRPPTNLTEAARNGDLEAVRAFLREGHTTVERTIGHASPLAAAAAFGHLPIVDELLAAGASLEPEGAMFPILHFPIMNGRLDVIERLLRAGASPQQHPHQLRFAAKQGEWHAVQMMLAAGFDETQLEASDRIALKKWRATQQEDAGFLQRWQKADRERRAAAEAKALAGRGRLEKEERDEIEREAVGLIAESPESFENATLESGTTLLAAAVEAGSAALVDALIAAKADVNAGDPSPLARAAARSLVSIAMRLLDAGADPNRKDADGTTPLIEASRAGCLEIVEVLLARGARAAGRTRTRETAATVAAGPFEKRIRAAIEAASAKKQIPRR